jgi:hypothetical protein
VHPRAAKWRSAYRKVLLEALAAEGAKPHAGEIFLRDGEQLALRLVRARKRLERG